MNDVVKWASRSRLLFRVFIFCSMPVISRLAGEEGLNASFMIITENVCGG